MTLRLVLLNYDYRLHKQNCSYLNSTFLLLHLFQLLNINSYFTFMLIATATVVKLVIF